jgi:hypothetical protein
MKLTEFITDIGRPVAFFPGLKKITKSTTATLLLCQLIYWTGKQTDQEGWIYKTSDDIEEETGLSYDEQVTARKQLVKLGFIEEKYKRLDHVMTFRIMANAINQEWLNGSLPIPETGITAFGNGASGQSLNVSETTSETTPEIKEKRGKPRDPLLDNAAIMMYRSISSRHIPTAMRKDVANEITNIELWGEVVKGWIGYGWNPGNITGMIEAYRSGGIQRRQTKQQPPPAQYVGVDGQILEIQ